jgi:glycosyltransferase involved in cell wall biosynthesis
MTHSFPSWICCQLGAREHFAIPRALHQSGQLSGLITDAWVRSNSPLNLLPAKILAPLRERFHSQLQSAPVYDATRSLVQFELTHKLSKLSGWELVIARNHWFQTQALHQLATISAQLSTQSRPILFAYSYAALELFRYAKRQGWLTVLGQIDPGPVEEKIIVDEHIKHSKYQSYWQPAPAAYWTDWHSECSLSDHILVNSGWSSRALQTVGISASKLTIVPLAYESSPVADSYVRTYPPTFSPERPLRVLFLGQIILRKGIIALLEAAALLQDLPIEFWLVGTSGIAKPDWVMGLNNIQWFGQVPRSAAAEYYANADLFLFPTLSDGFGLTQLEAQAWKLPMIVSTFCGEVVKDKVNGLVLPDVSAEQIAQALRFCLNHPDQLARFALQSSTSSGLVDLQRSLAGLTSAWL